MNKVSIISKEDIKTITSLEVSEMLEKEHSKIIRDIEGTKGRVGIIEVLSKAQLGVSDYFIESKYKDKSGKINKCYKCTKMGCEILGNKQQGAKGILFTAKYVKRFNEMEKCINNNKIKLTEEQELSLKILDGKASALDLKKYKEIVQFKALDGENAMLNCTQVVKALEQYAPGLTTTLLHEWFEYKGLGEYIKIGKDKKRTFVPNKKYMEFVAKEGHALTRKTINGEKVYIQYTTIMIARIMKYHLSSLVQFANSRI